MTAPLLLLGGQRSGTTALGAVLADAFDSAEGIFTVNGKLPYYLCRWVTDRDIQAQHLRVDEILYSIRRKSPIGPRVDEWLSRVETSLRDVASIVAHGQWSGGAVALRREVIARTYKGCDLWGDKYNEYLLDLPQVLEMLPDARVVMLFRHPESVASSMLSWSGDRPWRPTTREGCWEKWQYWNQQWLNISGNIPAASQMVVEYTDMCDSPRVQRELADFAEIPVSKLSTRLTSVRPSAGVSVPPALVETWESLVAMTTARP